MQFVKSKSLLPKNRKHVLFLSFGDLTKEKLYQQLKVVLTTLTAKTKYVCFLKYWELSGMYLSWLNVFLLNIYTHTHTHAHTHLQTQNTEIEFKIEILF